MNENRPLISVVTACYQAEEYLEQCIQSVVGQVFDDFEYIVIDGASRDGSTAIIDRYRDHIAYTHSRPDRGIADAFNQGLAHAHGRWIVFLNADDCYVDQHVLSSVAETLLQNDGVDLVYGQMQVIKRQDAIVPVSGVVGDTWNWNEFRLRSMIPHPASFTHCSYFEKYGTFDETFRNALDYELYLRAGSDLKVVFVPRMLAWMRDGGMSKHSAYRSFRESKDAQIKHHVYGKVMANVIYLAYVGRIILSRLLLRCHGNKG